jgi:hypothetical protein
MRWPAVKQCRWIYGTPGKTLKALKDLIILGYYERIGDNPYNSWTAGAHNGSRSISLFKMPFQIFYLIWQLQFRD